MKFNTPLRKTIALLAAPALSVAIASIFSSCENTTPTVGSELAKGEVQIALDSLTWDGTDQLIHRGENTLPVTCSKLVFDCVFDDAVDTRSTSNLIGRLSVPEYGDLHCSFVTRLMSITNLNILDSVKGKELQMDSMKLVLAVPRGQLTGDSLAPQQLRVFELTNSLPTDIDNRFDPTGYYNPADPIGSRSYTLSALSMNDSIYKSLSYNTISIPMSKQMAEATYKAYTDSVNGTYKNFYWPNTFEQYFHGIYVEPSFGRGCVANISDINFLLFFSYMTQETVTEDDKTTVKDVRKPGVIGVFQGSPIVLSSNNIKYTPSPYLKGRKDAGEAIITSPGGYRVNFTFPAQELVNIYNSSQSKLAVVSNLEFKIPAEEIANDYGLTLPPYLLLVKSAKLKEFLASNSLPDNKDSFYAAYDSKGKCYSFDNMRQYIIDVIENGAKKEDTEFTIIPVDITMPTTSSSSSSYYSLWDMMYGSTSSTETQTPTKCTPYIAKPSMCRLLFDKAETIFTYTIQLMK